MENDKKEDKEKTGRKIPKGKQKKLRRRNKRKRETRNTETRKIHRGTKTKNL